jgi:uncharacterized repeat protein (TIGR03987 family)
MLLVIASILITLALISYSFGVWSERIARYLKPWHVAAFWTGFAFDLGGTLGMHLMASQPFNILAPHTLTGQLALWLMLVHAAWAAAVLRKGTERSRVGFHKYSLVVWSIWLVPYFGGMALAMRR